MDFNRLPNFLIIGAAKSGTTTLFDIVGQHPAVYKSPEKEIRFFSNDELYKNGVDWYQNSFFSNSEKYSVRTEASPAYLTWSEKVAPRVNAVYGNKPIKFAAIFRDPVKRAYSHYWHRVRLGHEDPDRLSFAEAIHSEDQRLKKNWQQLANKGNGLYGYFRAGCYASLLKPYLELFPRENFFFMLQDDLNNDFNASFKKLMLFLEIDDTYPLKPVVINESAIPRDQNVYNLFNGLKKSKYKRFLKSVIPDAIRRWFRQDALMKPFNYPPMENEIKLELYARYADEIKRLEEMIGRDLSHWKYQ
jgi:hypothetical protein